ncbi:MAG: hypothetical protein KJO79_09185 [Verrucomicrobiae bacterium]|nr:hypothetical protein [Verrucomicrobiae bacterium]NNJ87342.1 hypothetical protein [Akkermansiaceae bacterium]
MKSSYIFLSLRLIVSLVLLQNVFFKFTGAEDAVALFTVFSTAITGDGGIEAALRISAGLVELIAVILLLRKKAASIASGAFLAVGVMVVLLILQFAWLGMYIDGDATQFVLSLTAMVIAWVVLFRFRGHLPVLGRFT